jgi:hypothetical protein
MLALILGCIGLIGLGIRHALRHAGFFLDMGMRLVRSLVHLGFSGLRGSGFFVGEDDAGHRGASKQNSGNEGRKLS